MNNNIKSRNLLVGIDYAKSQNKSKIDFLKTKCNKCGNEIKYKLAMRDIKDVEEYIEQLQIKTNKYDSLVEKIKNKKEAYNKKRTVINSFIVEALQELLEEEA